MFTLRIRSSSSTATLTTCGSTTLFGDLKQAISDLTSIPASRLTIKSGSKNQHTLESVHKHVCACVSSLAPILVYHETREQLMLAGMHAWML